MTEHVRGQRCPECRRGGGALTIGEMMKLAVDAARSPQAAPVQKRMPGEACPTCGRLAGPLTTQHLMQQVQYEPQQPPEPTAEEQATQLAVAHLQRLYDNTEQELVALHQEKQRVERSGWTASAGPIKVLVPNTLPGVQGLRRKVLVEIESRIAALETVRKETRARLEQATVRRNMTRSKVITERRAQQEATDQAQRRLSELQGLLGADYEIVRRDNTS